MHVKPAVVNVLDVISECGYQNTSAYANHRYHSSHTTSILCNTSANWIKVSQ